jgi:hypothetical protein
VDEAAGLVLEWEVLVEEVSEVAVDSEALGEEVLVVAEQVGGGNYYLQELL